MVDSAHINSRGIAIDISILVHFYLIYDIDN